MDRVAGLAYLAAVIVGVLLWSWLGLLAIAAIGAKP